jgi:hypothetical protein
MTQDEFELLKSGAEAAVAIKRLIAIIGVVCGLILLVAMFGG